MTLGFSSAEQRRGSSKPDCSFHSGPCAKAGPIGNGRLGRRSTLICPERLKDFGAEEFLNGDVKVFESSVSQAPEVQLLSTPKPVKKSGESKTTAKPAPEHLRFEDISAAAFKLQQTGIQKTPCTVHTHTHGDRARHTHTQTHTHSLTLSLNTHTHTHTQTHTHTHRLSHTHTHTHRERDTDTHRERDTDAHTHADTDTHRETDTHRDAHAHTHTHTHTERERHTERHTHRERETRAHTETRTRSLIYIYIYIFRQSKSMFCKRFFMF